MTPWTIVYYSHTEHLHAEHIRASNPDAQLLCLDTSNTIPKGVVWRAGDRLARRALQRAFSSIKHENILVIAWDVLLSARLPELKLSGVQGSITPTPLLSAAWMWWHEAELLPPPLRTHILGLVPLCVFAIDKASLWKILDPRFDEVFERDIMSELRFPTVCSFLKIPVSTFDPALFPPERILKSTTPKDIASYLHTFKEEIAEVPGLYHPVKFKVPLRGG